MGKLERRIKKQMNNDREDFDEWYAKHQNQLYAFSENNEVISHSNGKGLKAIAIKVLYPMLACISCIVICLTVLLTVFFTNEKNDIGITFGDENVYSTAISKDELQFAKETCPFISKMQITAQCSLLLRDDDSLVFLIIDGELETENDYYFIKVQIENNSHYEFAYKSVYYDLKNQIVLNNWKVTYGQGLNDINDLYVYYLLLEDKVGKNVYIEVHCFENDISYILNEFINSH